MNNYLKSIYAEIDKNRAVLNLARMFNDPEMIEICERNVIILKHRLIALN